MVSLQALRQEQAALTRLFEAVQAESSRPLYDSLWNSFVAELAAHARALEFEVAPPLARLSLSAQQQLAVLLDHLHQLRSSLQPGMDGAVWGDALRRYWDLECRTLTPMLERFSLLGGLCHYSVDPVLRVREWSEEWAARTGVTADEALRRPLAEIWPRLAGGSRLCLALPRVEGGASVWCPPWAERPAGLAPSALRELACAPFQTSLRPAVETALHCLRDTIGAQAAELFLVHPETSDLRPTFRVSTREAQAEPGSAAWVPVWGAYSLLGQLGLSWNQKDVALASSLSLLRWAATPLAVVLEPLLEAFRFPGLSSLSGAWVKGFLT